LRLLGIAVLLRGRGLLLILPLLGVTRVLLAKLARILLTAVKLRIVELLGH
jgi:hypothetical protein